MKPLFQDMKPISINLSNIVIMLLFLYFPFDSYFLLNYTTHDSRLIPDKKAAFFEKRLLCDLDKRKRGSFYQEYTCSVL